ncbi:MAG: hypothetical protein M0P43_03200 [Arcobacteraceae bacterium]|nr:hypothetical protein [Arcobacteraceae bacterium]MDY0327423.1 hypothetical protein [Arcobacteraceae bacterium]
MFISSPPNRIKPLLLRDVKTEALLVFIRTTLEQFFRDIDSGAISIQIGSQDDQSEIYNILKTLLSNLQDTIISSSTLRQFANTPKQNSAMIYLIKKELPLLHYYDSIVRQIEISLKSGENWIPEQLVIALLSEWILEEEKSIDIFPYLKQIDYIQLLSKYDSTRLEVKQAGNIHNALVISNMYKVATELIEKLKKTKYTIKQPNKKIRKK